MRDKLRKALLFGCIIAGGLVAAESSAAKPAVLGMASALFLYWLLKGDIGDPLKDWKPLTVEAWGPLVVTLAVSTLSCGAIALSQIYGFDVPGLLAIPAVCGTAAALLVIVYALRVGVVVYAKRHGIRWLL